MGNEGVMHSMRELAREPATFWRPEPSDAASPCQRAISLSWTAPLPRLGKGKPGLVVAAPQATT